MKTVTNYFVQQGSSGSLRIGNEDAFIVVAEVWRGSQIVSTRYVSTHNTKSEADAACAVLRNTR
jgi:hypothetical protein